MPAPAPAVVAALETPLQLMATAVREQIRLLEQRGGPCWKIPALKKRYQPASGMHYHFCPSFSSSSETVRLHVFAGQSLTLKCGRLCVVPGGIPHASVPPPPIRTTVRHHQFLQQNALHPRRARRRTRLSGAGQHVLFTSPIYADLVAFLERVCELNDEGLQASRRRDPRAADRLARAHGADFQAAASAALAGARHRHALPVAREAPREQRHPRLESLARNGAFAKYLSRVFRDRLVERLNEYINRVRIQNATDRPAPTQISVKAIGAACGSATRVFLPSFPAGSSARRRRTTGAILSATLEIERRPKTVLAEGAQFVAAVLRPLR